jgi:hypothetical protein
MNDMGATMCAARAKEQSLRAATPHPLCQCTRLPKKYRKEQLALAYSNAGGPSLSSVKLPEWSTIMPGVEVSIGVHQDNPYVTASQVFLERCSQAEVDHKRLVSSSKTYLVILNQLIGLTPVA